MRTRRIIYLLMALAVGAALLVPRSLPIHVTRGTRQVYDRIESLSSGAVVMVSFDHEASSTPEIGPLADAIIAHCFRRDLKVVGLALFAEGAAIGENALTRRAAAAGKMRNTDWAYLGFRPQYTAAILGLGESIAEVFPTDYDNRPVDGIPLLAEVRNLNDVALVVSVADGGMPTYWVEYAGARYNQEVIAALSAVMVTSYIPYLESGQLAGILAGLKGAAEYEKLLGQPGAGHRGMNAQSAAHALLAILIVVGGVQSWRTRRSRASRREAA